MAAWCAAAFYLASNGLQADARKNNGGMERECVEMHKSLGFFTCFSRMVETVMTKHMNLFPFDTHSVIDVKMIGAEPGEVNIKSNMR